MTILAVPIDSADVVGVLIHIFVLSGVLIGGMVHTEA